MSLAVKSFLCHHVGSAHQDSNPPSTKIIGRFEIVKRLHHQNLCRYLDIEKGKRGRLYVVSEFHPFSLSRLLEKGEPVEEGCLHQYAWQILTALDSLHKIGVLHLNLTPENILLTAENEIKLSDYGLHYITEGGNLVPFQIGSPTHLSPELLISYNTKRDAESNKCDVWALGLILVELMSGHRLFSPTRDGRGILLQILELYGYNLAEAQGIRDCKSLPYLIDSFADCLTPTIASKWSPQVLDFVRLCLKANPSERHSSQALLGHPLFKGRTPWSLSWKTKPWLICELKPAGGSSSEGDGCSDVPFERMYDFWRLSGGSLQSEVLSASGYPGTPSIKRVPTILRQNASLDELDAKPTKLDGGFYDNRWIPLRLGQVADHLELPKEHSSGEGEEPLLRPGSSSLVRRETDISYQLQRIETFRRLLSSGPSTRAEMIAQARVDIPPQLRAEVWCAVLGVDGDTNSVYNMFKDRRGPSDHQISVDIPRCHQYHTLLASAEGHDKFRKILRAWVKANPSLVYWQGLDSLLAPFLVLNFHDESRAFACLNSLVRNRLSQFYVSDGMPALQEHLTRYRHLMAYHDPHMASHLSRISFTADLYAIPWLLTLFAHLFPMHRILRLWDTLLPGPMILQHFVAVSIIRQLRTRLLELDFNQCIMLMSNLPDISVEKVLEEAQLLMDSTPYPSLKQTRKKPEGEWWAMVPSWERTRQELAPRITAKDMKRIQASLVVVDVRSEEEFRQCHFKGSVHLNRSSTKPLGVPVTLEKHIHQREHIVIIGSGKYGGSDFANELVHMKVSQVSVLHEGIDALLAAKHFPLVFEHDR